MAGPSRPPPPEYLMPPLYKASSSTVDVLHESASLPSYDSPPSLEPWLASLRRAEWPQTASLALFLPPEDRQECWCDRHERILRGLIGHGLPLEQEEGAESDWMLWDLPEAVCSFVSETLPPELRRTGFSFALGTGSRRKLSLNPLLISAIDRLDTASGPSHSTLSHASQFILTILPSALSYKLSKTSLPSVDLERLLTALFIILCRSAWASSAEARIQSAEAHEHLLQALPSILRKMIPHKTRWKSGTRTPGAMSPPATPKQHAHSPHHLVSVHA